MARGKRAKKPPSTGSPVFPSEILSIIVKYWILLQQASSHYVLSPIDLPPADRFGFFRRKDYLVNRFVVKCAAEHYGKLNTVVLRNYNYQASFIQSIENSVFYNVHEVLPLRFIRYLQIRLPIRVHDSASTRVLILPFNKDVDIEVPNAVSFIQQYMPDLKKLVFTTDLANNAQDLSQLYSWLESTPTSFDLIFQSYHRPLLIDSPYCFGRKGDSSQVWTSVRAPGESDFKIVRVRQENDIHLLGDVGHGKQKNKNKSRPKIPCFNTHCNNFILSASASAPRCLDCDVVLCCSVTCRHTNNLSLQWPYCNHNCLPKPVPGSVAGLKELVTIDILGERVETL